MITQLSVEQAITIIQAGELYEAGELVDWSAKFIADNFNAVFEEKYQPTDLSNDLIKRIFNKKVSSNVESKFKRKC